MPAIVIDQTPPAIYLPKEPTEEEATLAEQADVHTGVAKVAIRTHAVSVWAGGKRAMERRLRKVGIWFSGLAVANIAAIGLWWLHRDEDSVRSQERAAELARDVDGYRKVTEDMIKELRTDIRELRAAMRKMSGVDPIEPSRTSLDYSPTMYGNVFGSFRLESKLNQSYMGPP